MAMRHSCTSSGSIEVMVLGSSVTATIRSVFGSKTCGVRAMLPIEPYGHGAAMRVEPLGLRERDRGRCELGQRRRIAAKDRGALHEIEHAQTRGEARRPGGRQNVVRATDIVADRLRRVVV